MRSTTFLAAENRGHSQIILRITALWAFSEAFLGGILHGFKIPFTGLFLSLIAAICITIIAIHRESKKQIITATLVIIALKFILSPHTPPTAYFAVFLEAMFGVFLFGLVGKNKQGTKIAAFILSVFCVMYAAFHHLIVLTLVFGKSFWQALAIFLNKITAIFITNPQEYSQYIVIGYLVCHLIGGILGGLMNIKIIQNIDSDFFSKHILTIYPHALKYATEANANVLNNEKKYKRSFWFIFILFLLLIFSYLPMFKATLMKDKMVEVLVRGLLIIVIWNYFLARLLRHWLKNWIESYKHQKTEYLEQVLTLLPDIKKIVLTSWLLVKNENFFLRYKNFLLLVFCLTIQPFPTISTEQPPPQ